MKKWIIAIVVIAILAGGTYVVMGRQGKKTGAASATGADLAPVKKDDRVVADAKVVPVRSAALSLSVGGVVGSLLVAEGEQVKEGQVLLRVDDRDLQARLRQAQAGLAAAEAELANSRAGARPQEIATRQAAVDQAQANYETAKADLARTETLFQQGAAALQQLEQAKSAYQTAEVVLRQARAALTLSQEGTRPEVIAQAEAQVSLSRAALEQAQVALALTELHAPFSGAIASLDIKAGEFVVPGTPILRLADLSTMRIETEDLTELNVVSVKEGDQATVTLDAIPGLELPGRVTRIKDFGENKQGDITYTVIITPDQQDARLRWNMVASVTINTGAPAKADSVVK